MKRRPLIITLLGWLLILLGATQFVLHVERVRPPLQAGDIGVPLFELVILVSGVFLLRGHNWARWLVLAWIGFHVAISSLHAVLAGVVHGLIFLLFAWLLFRPEVNAWFRRESRTPGQSVQ